MKVRDEMAWHTQLAELAQDKDPRAAALRQFLITWAEASEMDLRQSYNAAQGAWGDFDNDPLEDIALGAGPPVGALRNTLGAVEAQLGAISTGFLGQILILLETHWRYGEGLYESLTPIEQNIYRSVALLKQMQLMAQAEETE